MEPYDRTLILKVHPFSLQRVVSFTVHYVESIKVHVEEASFYSKNGEGNNYSNMIVPPALTNETKILIVTLLSSEVAFRC